MKMASRSALSARSVFGFSRGAVAGAACEQAATPAPRNGNSAIAAIRAAAAMRAIFAAGKAT